jgi:hypothetical protein
MATDILGSFLQGQQAGQQQRTRRTLSEFLQPALGGDQNALSRVYAADPDAGMQVQGMVQKQAGADREAKLGELELVARAWHAAPPEMRQQLYPSIAELTEAVLPQFAGKIPREYSPQYEANIDKFLAGFAGQQDNTPASIRELQMLQANPELAELDMRRRTAGFDRPQLIQTDSGYAWATPQGATPLNYGEEQPAPSFDQSAVQRNLAMLGAAPGVQMTSGLRTPERNAAVGGKPNSQHLRGTAGDYVVPQAQKAAFMQQVEAAGLQAIDEGDHVHVQQPRSAGNRVMPAPKAGGPSDFERKIEMARSMGATPDQLKQMVIGESGGGKPSATQIKLANTAKSKLVDLKAMEDQLAKVEAAFKPLKGSFSAGPGGGYLPTVEGKQFDAAVALLKGMARKLTRTPGEGAMSDYESKLAELANPSRSEYEDVTADQIQQLRALVQTTRQGYEALLEDAGGSTSNLPGSKSGGGDIDSILSKYGVR